MNLTPPLRLQIVNEAGDMPTAWMSWFSNLAAVAVPKSGTTADRPTKGLYPGMQYFDTSLGANGKPIWVNKDASGWVYADGTAA